MEFGSTHWAYDTLDRATSITDPFGGTVSYGYDAVGNRTSLTYPDGKAASYGYDPADRLAQVTDWSSYVTSYTYDAADQLATTLLPNGVVSSYTYDSAGRLTQLTHAAGADTLSSFQYTYDPVGNRTQAIETLKSPGGGPTVTVKVTEFLGQPPARANRLRFRRHELHQLQPGHRRRRAGADHASRRRLPLPG